MSKKINGTLQIRRDTSANWTSKNPILLEGELGYDTTNKILKIGNGSTTWNSLAGNTDNKTNTSVLPNNSGEIKTKYRIAQKGYTSGATWYYKICDFYTNNNGNYSSAILSGRIGGWTSDNMSYINALVWNRGTPGIAMLDIAGNASQMSSIWSICDLVLYTNDTSSATVAATATLYAKCVNYFTFDLDLELFQSASSITYDGTYISTTPTGTLSAQASTSTKRVEVVNGKLLVGGNQLAFTSQIPTVNNGTLTIQKNGTSVGTFTANSSSNVTANITVPTKVSELTNDSGYIKSYVNTTNTAGSTDTSSKIFLVGTTAQAASAQTYSHDTAYVGTDGCLYSGGTKVLTAHQSLANYSTLANTIKALSISGKTITYTKGDGTTGTLTTQDTNTTYGNASASTAGLIKVSSVNTSAVTVNSESTTAGRYYPVELNSDGKAIVNVPWTDNNTVYSHPTYTAITGKPAANLNPGFGGSAIVSQITTNTLGHVTGATDRTITIPSTLSNGTGTAGLIKTTSTVTSNSGYTACPVISGVPYYKDTNTTYSVATTSANGLMSSTDKSKLDGIATGANNYSLPTATSSVLGGVKTGSNITNSSGTISVTKSNVTSALGYTPMSSTITNFEMNSSGSLKSYGGFIDFHFHNSDGKPTNASGTVVDTTPDYTSRIIENAAGQIDINNVKMKSGTLTATSVVENGTALSSKYLGISSTASNSTKLNGQEASYYLNYNNLTNKPTIPSVDSALSTTSTNPVQNKIVTANINNLTTSINSVSSTAGSNSTSISTLNSKVSTLQTTVNNLNSDLSELRSDHETDYEALLSMMSNAGTVEISGQNTIDISVDRSNQYRKISLYIVTDKYKSATSPQLKVNITAGGSTTSYMITSGVSVGLEIHFISGYAYYRNSIGTSTTMGEIDTTNISKITLTYYDNTTAKTVIAYRMEY